MFGAGEKMEKRLHFLTFGIREMGRIENGETTCFHLSPPNLIHQRKILKQMRVTIFSLIMGLNIYFGNKIHSMYSHKHKGEVRGKFLKGLVGREIF